MILPGGIIGGVPLVPASVGWISRGTTGSGTSKTLAGVNFGDVLKGRNKRWIVVCIQDNAAGSPATVTGTPTIGGVNAPVIATGLTNHASLNVRFTWFAGEIPTGASGDVAYTSSNSDSNTYQIYRCVNLDFTTVSGSAFADGGNQAVLSIDCPAGGGIVGSGYYAYSSGSTPTSANFNNLTTLDFVDSNVGYTAAGDVFASAQTALDTTYDPTPNTNLTRSHGTVISVPYAL